ncbi:MAG: hypothetical protein RIE56_12110 [Amphiplicatus sp.]
MRRPITFGVIVGMTLFASFTPQANAQMGVDMRWEVLAAGERRIIDRLAAQFYEEELRYAQSSQIEAHTGELYAHASPNERDRFRNERRASWNAMTDAQRRTLRGAKRPSYRNLTEAQKAPFRRYAIDQLGAAGAIDQEALEAALRKDI